MRVEHFLLSLFAAVAVYAAPQTEETKPPRPRTVDKSIPTFAPKPVGKPVGEPVGDHEAIKVAPRTLQLPGFCPNDVTQILGSLLGLLGDNDCRCGQSVGLQVAGVETDSVQSLGSAPAWSIGGNSCGCSWQENQCGCYDGVSNGDGWLLGHFGAGAGAGAGAGVGVGVGLGLGKRGDDDDNRCTVYVTETAPYPVPMPTNPGNCGKNDRYCTVTVTVSQPGQEPGQPLYPPVPTVTERYTTTQEPYHPEPTTVTIGEGGGNGGGGGYGGGEHTTSSYYITSSRVYTPTLSRTTSRTTSVPTFVTVNAAAAAQTGMMALGAMFGGAAMLVNA